MKINLNGETFTNVFIYMADALRYDHPPKGIAEDNRVLKTIASGLHTPPCISTILTGLYPPQHGVYAFNNIIQRNKTTMFDLVGGSCRTYGVDKVFMESIENLEETEDPDVWKQWLRTLEEPFACFKRDLFTHAPYNQEWEGRGEFDTTGAYMSERMPDLEQIKDEYKKSVTAVEERFYHEIEILKQQGLLEDTLVIFTADHGEVLGEYGIFGHGSFQVPENVYVPTIFFNHRLTVQGDTIAHVDLLPTINSLLGSPASLDIQFGGEDLTTQTSEKRKVFNINVDKDEWATWEKDGGIVHNNTSIIPRLKSLTSSFTTHWYNSYARRHPIQVFKLYSNRNVTYGQPTLSRKTSESFTKKILSRRTEQTQKEIDEESKERLRALGYRDEEIE